VNLSGVAADFIFSKAFVAVPGEAKYGGFSAINVFVNFSLYQVRLPSS
jgi:hypothetical protein